MLARKHTKSATFLLVAAAVGLFSCTQSSESAATLQTANNETIELTSSDKSVPLVRLDLASIKKYERYVNSMPHHQVPLNKVFFRNHTGIYYGIPIDGTVKELAAEYRHIFASGIIDAKEKNDSTDASFFLQDSAIFITTAIFKTSKKHILVAAAISNDSATIRTIYNNSTLQGNVKHDAH